MAVNLIFNPGFEVASQADWTKTVSDGAIADETTLVHSGAHAVKITAGTSHNTKMTQNIPLVPGVPYSFSFWTRGDGTYGGRYSILDANHVGVYIVGALTATGVTGTAYKQVVFTFVAPPACTLITLELDCPATTAGIVYFDDLSLIGAPVPYATKYILLYDPNGSVPVQVPVTVIAGALTDGLTFSGLDLATSNDAQRNALGIGERKLASVPLVDMNLASAQPLYVVPSGFSCAITGVVFRNCSGSLSTASVSFGFDSGATNVISTATHTGLTDATHQDIALPAAGAVVGVAGTNGTFSCIDSILQSAAMTVTLDIFGYLF